MVVITVAGVVASCLSAALWGFYPVLARYLMHGQLSGINPPATSVLAIVCFWNTMIVGSYYAYVKLIRKPRHTSIASEDDIKEKNNGKDKNNDE
jgi:hypothetical protein